MTYAEAAMIMMSGGGTPTPPGGGSLAWIDALPTIAEADIGEGWSVKIKITNTVGFLLEKYSNDGIGDRGEQYPYEDYRKWTWLMCACKGGVQCAIMHDGPEENSKTQSTTYNPETQRVNTVCTWNEWFSDFSGSNARLGTITTENSSYYAGVGDYSILFDCSYTSHVDGVDDPYNKPNERTYNTYQKTAERVQIYFAGSTGFYEPAFWDSSLTGVQRRDLYCDFINAYYKNHILPYSK